MDTTPKPSTNTTEENSLKYLCYLITAPAVHPSTEVNRSIAAVLSHHPRLNYLRNNLPQAENSASTLKETL